MTVRPAGKVPIAPAAWLAVVMSVCSAGMVRADEPLLWEVARAPDAGELHATVQTLVNFGTRHSLSDTVSAKRGIGAARRWVQSQFEQIGRACGGCLRVVTPSQTVTGPRVPKPTEIVDVVAIQTGATDPQRVIVLTGHVDSRVTDPQNATADAPGADDDASGVALVLEAARILSRYKFAATLVYGVLSGEEQGLYGGKVLAEYARHEGWRVEADLNNDIVGGTRGLNGVVDNTRVRIFSEGVRATETPEEARQRRSQGGEDDSASRNVARYAKGLAEAYIPNWNVALVYRLDRFGRGGALYGKCRGLSSSTRGCAQRGRRRIRRYHRQCGFFVSGQGHRHEPAGRGSHGRRAAAADRCQDRRRRDGGHQAVVDGIAGLCRGRLPCALARYEHAVVEFFPRCGRGR